MLARPTAAAVNAVRATGARSLFAARAAAGPAQVAVDEEFPSLPRVTPQPAAPAQVTASTAASGLKLASDNRAGLVATLGVEIAAGSRVESDETTGLSQLAAKMAFRATTARSDLRLYRDIEAIGGVIHKAAGRDFVRYNISVLPDQLDAAAAILAETTLAPRLAHWDVALQKQQLAIDAELAAACSERTVAEALHAAAFYDDVALGRPSISAENLAALDEAALAGFYEQYVNNQGLVLVGAGVEHAQLTELANTHFGDLAKGAAPACAPKATYVGGETRVKKAGVRNTYVALGFPTAGRKAADHGAAHVLQALLASRVNHKAVSGFHACYADAGLVGLTGYAAPADAGRLVDAFVAEIKKVAAAAPSAEELKAAKTIAALEATGAVATRQGQVAVLGAAAFAQAASASPAQVIEGVSAQAVQELAQKAVAARPSLAAVGKLSSVPRLDAVLAKLK